MANWAFPVNWMQSVFVHNLGVAMARLPYWCGACACPNPATGDLPRPSNHNPSLVHQLMTQVQLRAVSGWRIATACLHVNGWWLCGGGVAPLTQEVSRAMGVVEWHLRHCVHWGCTVLVATFVDFRWSVKLSVRMGVLEEQNGVVFGVSCLLPSSLHNLL